MDIYLEKKECRDKSDYAYTTWKCFVNNKDHICINLFSQEGYWNRHGHQMIIDLVMHDIDADEGIFGYSISDEPRASEDMTNIFKREILQVFKPKTITITSLYAYRISLWSLLSVIKNYMVDEIILEIGQLWNNLENVSNYDKVIAAHPITSELRDAYNSANYTISDFKKNDHKDRTECIIQFKS